MLLIPYEVFVRYVAHLHLHKVAKDRHGDYKKWLRYFLDFCDKYPVPESRSERVRLFCEKLQEKKQSEQQRLQTAHAVSLYFEMMRQGLPAQPQKDSSINAKKPDNVAELPVNEIAGQDASQNISEEPYQIRMNRSPSQYTETGYQEKSKSPEWDALLAAMAAEIKEHYNGIFV